MVIKLKEHTGSFAKGLHYYFLKKGANYSLHLEEGVENLAYDVWSSSFNFMGLGLPSKLIKKKVGYQSYVPIKTRKDSKVTMRFSASSNNFTTGHNHLEIQAHDYRGDKMWFILTLVNTF